MKTVEDEETAVLRKTFKRRVKEKNDKNKLPWERARDNGENIIKEPIISWSQIISKQNQKHKYLTIY